VGKRNGRNAGPLFIFLVQSMGRRLGEFMTTETPDGGSRAEEILGRARRHHAEIGSVLEQALMRMKQGEEADMRAFSATIQAYWKSLQTVLEREIELEKRAFEQGERLRGGALDLEAARAEVGRRLACLKAARGDRGFSDGS